MLACHCLNVIIETAENDLPVSEDALGLSQSDLEDAFFKQNLRQVGKLININKVHSSLIKSRTVGPWVINYCINCEVDSHAVHREKGASCILINSSLLSTQSVEAMRKSENYSSLFKIVVSADRMKGTELASPGSYLSNEVENVVKGFKQIAADALNNEAQMVRRKIQQYTDLEYAKLEALREKTFREQQALTKIILNYNVLAETLKLSPTSTKDSPTSTSSDKGPSRLSGPLETASLNPPSSPKVALTRHAPKRQKSCPAGAHVNSLDTEGLFEFDGIDDIHGDAESEGETSEVDDNATDKDDVAPNRTNHRTPSDKSAAYNMAKSLPMTIPAFLSQSRNSDRVLEDFHDVEPLNDTVDIAASMKALAKSVHGDTVFGDLPKPRYTYI